jgi:hypothetical protein
MASCLKETTLLTIRTLNVQSASRVALSASGRFWSRKPHTKNNNRAADAGLDHRDAHRKNGVRGHRCAHSSHFAVF